MTPIIELKNVSLKFADSEPLFNDINLKILQGESLVIVGPSGHGKSSLLKLIGSLVSPTSGEVLWENRSTQSLTSKEKLTWLRKIGMLFQKNALFDSMTVYDNVAFPLLETTRLTNDEVKNRVETYLHAVRLTESSSLFPNQISGGMQKRLGIARALALEPKIVLYDDPTAGLDPITSRTIIQLIKELKAKFNSTIVAVTNDMNRAYQLADRILFVHNKTITDTGNKQQTLAFSDPRIQQFIHGEANGPLSSFEQRA